MRITKTTMLKQRAAGPGELDGRREQRADAGDTQVAQQQNEHQPRPSARNVQIEGYHDDGDDDRLEDRQHDHIRQQFGEIDRPGIERGQQQSVHASILLLGREGPLLGQKTREQKSDPQSGGAHDRRPGADGAGLRDHAQDKDDEHAQNDHRRQNLPGSELDDEILDENGSQAPPHVFQVMLLA